MVTDLVQNFQVPRVSSRLRQRASAIGSWLCVGLDPFLNSLPAGLPQNPAGVVQFCRDIIEATCDYAVCFKINFAFFESLGQQGSETLAQVRASIPEDIPAIADAKRGDVAVTAGAYATAIFDQLRFDAVTLNPYIGWDSVHPWTVYEGRALFILCKTSNPGAPHFQDLETDGKPLFLRIAQEALRLDSAAEIGVVVGATFPQSLRKVRELADDLLILSPGVGAQGATVKDAISHGANAKRENLLVAISREIMHASNGRDFAEAARKVAADRAAETWGQAG
jgi:orotidine 5'-phosphate decarboxylase subfamily 2